MDPHKKKRIDDLRNASVHVAEAVLLLSGSKDAESIDALRTQYLKLRTKLNRIEESEN